MALKSAVRTLAIAVAAPRLGVVATPVAVQQKPSDPKTAHDECLSELETHLNAVVDAFETEDLSLEDFADD